MQSMLRAHVKPFRASQSTTVIFCKAGRTVRTATDGERKTWKESLKKAVATTKRGKASSPEQQTDILQKVEQLEASSPTRNPAYSQLLSGDWSLLYTGPGKADDVNWEKRTGGVEGPFLAALRPLTANLIKSRGILQVIDAENGTVQNIAEFRVANAVNGYLNVAGTVEPIGHEGNSAEVIRVDVGFTSFSLKIGVLPRLKIPLTWPKTPKGWVDTTYLDQDFRIGRGDKGSVFVTARKR